MPPRASITSFFFCCEGLLVSGPMNARRSKALLAPVSSALVLLVWLSGCSLAIAQTPSDDGPGFWKILDTRKVGAQQFVKVHPEWDGRGAVIAVLDTGVDMLAAGLETTTDGKPKVIDARDFSGQGEVMLTPATVETIDGVKYLSTDEGRVRGFEGLPVKPEGEDGWQLGFLKEARFKNSDVTDINLNRSETDRFAVLTVDTGDGLVAYIDAGGDNDVTGEKPITSYKDTHKPFVFHLPDPKHQRSPVAFAVHIDEDGSLVTFHFDDGGHGTHVAGIAAGHGLMGRKGFNGVAPGAQVLSLKIGDNTLSGGATTSDSMSRAIEFAGEWSKEKQIPVVINLSYGIGSEIEGESDIDLALDSALQRFPLLSASVSAGNEGPGLSTVGTPAASYLATSVAAMLPKDTAETLFGARLGGDRIFAFSSRGGELSKPDVLAPGIASSSTPAHDSGDVKGGTSMAAPQIAGVYALMASAAVATKTRFTNTTLKRALLFSCTPIPDYLPIAQGRGVPNVGRAFAAVQKLAKHAEPFKVVGYKVSTRVPTSASRNGAAAYWRTGTYLPPEGEGHEFKIEVDHPDKATAKDMAAFQTLLKFKSLTRWLSVDRKTGKLQGNKPLFLEVSYDHDALKTPGVYTGRVVGTPDDGGGIPALELWSTVVVPHTFDTRNGYALDQNGKLQPLEIRRVPILVPPGASQLTVKVNTPKGQYGNTTLYLNDPTGRAWELDSYRASSESNKQALGNVDSADLVPGIWEIVLYSTFRNTRPSHYDLSVRFRGISAETITRYRTRPGEEPSGRFAVTNRYDTRFSGRVAGTVFGYRRSKTHEVLDDTHSQTFNMNDEVQRIDLVLRLDPATYNRFTDVAVNVLDGSDTALVKEGFSNGVCRVSIPKSEGNGSYTLQVKGALAKASDDPWNIEIEETYVWAKPVGAMVGNNVVLYPQVEANLSFTLDRSLPKVPSGFSNYGEISFRDRKTGETWLVLPMELK